MSGLTYSAPISRVNDGDTFDADCGEDLARVHVVGIDTPERGESGFKKATRAAERAFEGKAVTLTIGGAKSR